RRVGVTYISKVESGDARQALAPTEYAQRLPRTYHVAALAGGCGLPADHIHAVYRHYREQIAASVIAETCSVLLAGPARDVPACVVLKHRKNFASAAIVDAHVGQRPYGQCRGRSNE